MRIFDLFEISPVRHFSCMLGDYGSEFTYCQTCTRLGSKMCHKLCRMHNKPYLPAATAMKKLQKSLVSLTEEEVDVREV